MAEPELSQGFPSPPPAYPPGESTGPPGRTPSWGLPDALATWVVGMFFGLVTTSAVLALAGAETMDEVSLTSFALGQSGMWVGFLVMVVVISSLKGSGLVRDFGLRFRPVDVLIGGICGFGGQMLINVVYLPVVEWTDVTNDDISKTAENLTDRADGPTGVVLLVVIVGIMAPIVEELFYRGLLQRSMARRLGVIPGLVLTSLIFGIVHFQPLLIPGLAVAGLIFGLLAQRTGRLGPAIVAHMAFNVTTVVSLVSGA